MSSLQIDPRDRSMILAHYYRAMVGRADVWRTRMDATTNWAIGATAAVISFTLGNSAVPHYVVWIATFLTLIFLQLEARRLTFYNLWQQRVLMLEAGLIRPALAAARGGAEAQADAPHDASSEDGRWGSDLATALDASLGKTVPSMSRWKAIARRLRRIYLYLFGVQLFAWALKLANHPSAATSPEEFVARAHVAAAPGSLVLGIAALASLGAVAMAFTLGGVDRDPA
jgi:uncharacterized membrane protein